MDFLADGDGYGPTTYDFGDGYGHTTGGGIGYTTTFSDGHGAGTAAETAQPKRQR